jgi:membrane associated rhomboid family serine protease
MFDFKNIPPVVKNLLIINGLFYLATILLKSQGIDLIDYLGLHHWSSDKFMVHQLVTHFFMHSSSDFTHVLFNMFAVWMFGKTLEQVWGQKRFLIYYVVTAIGAACLYLIYITYDLSSMNNVIVDIQNNPSPELFAQFVGDYLPLESLNQEFRIAVIETMNGWLDSPGDLRYKENAVYIMEDFLKMKRDIPMVGASGAVFGILLAFGMLFPNTELMLLFPPIPIKAKWFVLFYGAFELYSGLANNPNDNVAHFAHLGGMLFGFILIKMWQKDRGTFY